MYIFFIKYIYFLKIKFKKEDSVNIPSMEQVLSNSYEITFKL